MTMLPTLPSSLGGHVDYEFAISKIREENKKGLSYLADLLEAEKEIEQCGLHYYVLNDNTYKPVLSDKLPKEFLNIFEEYEDYSEEKWFSSVYKAWFSLLMETGKQTGSNLLADWAKWELSLRTNLLINASNKASTENDYSELLNMVNKLGATELAADIAEAYKSFQTPLEAEKYLDQSRIEYLRKSVSQFSFSIDELVAYLLELRVHNRYSKMRPEEGRRILEEVTKL